MKLSGTKTEHVDIEVSESEVIKVAIQLLRGKYKLNSDQFLKDGWIHEWDEHYHGSHTHSTLREATAEDVQVFGAIDLLHGLEK